MVQITIKYILLGTICERERRNRIISEKQFPKYYSPHGDWKEREFAPAPMGGGRVAALMTGEWSPTEMTPPSSKEWHGGPGKEPHGSFQGP